MRQYTREGYPLITGDDAAAFADQVFALSPEFANRAQQVATRLRMSDTRDAVLTAALDFGLSILERQAITDADRVRKLLHHVGALRAVGTEERQDA